MKRELYLLTEQEARASFELEAAKRLLACECEADTGFRCRRCRHWERKQFKKGDGFDLFNWIEAIARRWATLVVASRKISAKEGSS